MHGVTRRCFARTVGAIELDLWGAAQCFERLQLYRQERERQAVRLKLLCGHASSSELEAGRCVHVGYLEQLVSHNCEVPPVHIHDVVYARKHEQGFLVNLC